MKHHHLNPVAVEPHWERGRRCHGYWIGLARFGWVGIDIGGAKYGYGWLFDPPCGNREEGEATTLREAKRRVEKCYEQWKQ